MVIRLGRFNSLLNGCPLFTSNITPFCTFVKRCYVLLDSSQLGLNRVGIGCHVKYHLGCSLQCFDVFKGSISVSNLLQCLVYQLTQLVGSLFQARYISIRRVDLVKGNFIHLELTKSVHHITLRLISFVYQEAQEAVLLTHVANLIIESSVTSVVIKVCRQVRIITYLGPLFRINGSLRSYVRIVGSIKRNVCPKFLHTPRTVAQTEIELEIAHWMVAQVNLEGLRRCSYRSAPSRLEACSVITVNQIAVIRIITLCTRLLRSPELAMLRIIVISFRNQRQISIGVVSVNSFQSRLSNSKCLFVRTNNTVLLTLFPQTFN